MEKINYNQNDREKSNRNFNVNVGNKNFNSNIGNQNYIRDILSIDDIIDVNDFVFGDSTDIIKESIVTGESEIMWKDNFELKIKIYFQFVFSGT